VADDIEAKVIEMVAEQMGPETSGITRGTSFTDDLNCVPLDVTELVAAFESAFGISIPDEEAEKIQTVGQAIDYIKVIDIVAQKLDVDGSEITRETSLVDDEDVALLDMAELVGAFEEAFEISIPEEEVEKIQTVGQIFVYVSGGPGGDAGGGIVGSIENKVIDIVAEQMDRDRSEITRETSFVNDLNADSLDTVELVMEFEDAFEISIPDDEAEKIQTVGQAIDHISRHANKA